MIAAFASAIPAATLFACSGSTDGGQSQDAGSDVLADTTSGGDASGDGQSADAGSDGAPLTDGDAGKCGPVDGDPYFTCVGQKCCAELTACQQACSDYVNCLYACAQMDGGQTCHDQCGTQNPNGKADFLGLYNCGHQRCAGDAASD